MPQTAEGAEVHQTLDVHRHFAAQIAFDETLSDLRTQRIHFGLGEIFDLGGRIDTGSGMLMPAIRAMFPASKPLLQLAEFFDYQP
jgi:hypothetical protein